MDLVLLVVVVISWAYWVVATVQVGRLLSTDQPPSRLRPPVSVLKPVHGLDYQAEQNLESFCLQDYPAVEVLFGVEDRTDPSLPLLRELVCRHPRARLVVGSGAGTNPKVSLLQALAAEAGNELLVVSDADMRVEPDHLARVVAPLDDPSVGVVICPYRGVEPVTLTARLEALYMDCQFVPSAVVASTLVGLPFGLGSTMALRRADLERIGGFAALSDNLADDHELGSRIGGLGLRVGMIGVVVSCVVGDTTFAEQWRREVRWARATRVSRPLLYPGYLLTFSTPLAAFYAGLAASLSAGLGVLGGSLLVRWAAGWLVTGWNGNRVLRRWLVLLPVRDALTALVWVAGLFGRRVWWRGRRYLVSGRGRMVPVEQRPPAKAVSALDAALRRVEGVFEVSDHPESIFRVAVRRNRSVVELGDGTRLEAGDRIGELHFRNEAVPPMGSSGPGVPWATAFRERLEESFRGMARAAEEDPRLEGVSAFRGDLWLSETYRPERVARVLARLGLEVADSNRSQGMVGPVEAVRRAYATMLVSAFQPASDRGRRLRRIRVWVSTAELLRRYG